MNFKKIVKKLDTLDIGLIKFASAIFVLWLIALLPGFATWVQSVGHWWFLIIFIIICIRPIYRAYIKK